MGLFSGGETLAGLDLGSSAVKAVELRRVRAGFELVRAGLEPLEPGAMAEGAIGDPDSVAEAIRRVFSRSRIRARKVATSVSGHSVIVKKLTLPAMSPEELEESIQWEARQVIPFDLSDVHLDHQVLGDASAAGDTQVLLVAARKERVASRLGAIARAGLSPLIVDVDGFALQNAYEANYGPGSAVTSALLHIGAAVTNLVVTRGGVPLFTRDLSAGGNQLTGLLQKELRIDFEEAERMKRESGVEALEAGPAGALLHSVVETLLLEIRKSLDLFEAGAEGESIQRVYVSGGCSGLAGLVERLQSGLDPPLEVLDPFKSIAVGRGVNEESLYQQAPSLAVAVGLALRGFHD